MSDLIGAYGKGVSNLVVEAAGLPGASAQQDMGPCRWLGARCVAGFALNAFM